MADVDQSHSMAWFADETSAARHWYKAKGTREIGLMRTARRPTSICERMSGCCARSRLRPTLSSAMSSAVRKSWRNTSGPGRRFRSFVSWASTCKWKTSASLKVRAQCDGRAGHVQLLGDELRRACGTLPEGAFHWPRRVLRRAGGCLADGQRHAPCLSGIQPGRCSDGSPLCPHRALGPGHPCGLRSRDDAGV